MMSLSLQDTFGGRFWEMLLWLIAKALCPHLLKHMPKGNSVTSDAFWLDGFEEQCIVLLLPLSRRADCSLRCLR